MYTDCDMYPLGTVLLSRVRDRGTFDVKSYSIPIHVVSLDMSYEGDTDTLISTVSFYRGLFTNI